MYIHWLLVIYMYCVFYACGSPKNEFCSLVAIAGYSISTHVGFQKLHYALWLSGGYSVFYACGSPKNEFSSLVAGYSVFYACGVPRNELCRYFIN